MFTILYLEDGSIVFIRKDYISLQKLHCDKYHSYYRKYHNKISFGSVGKHKEVFDIVKVLFYVRLAIRKMYIK